MADLTTEDITNLADVGQVASEIRDTNQSIIERYENDPTLLDAERKAIIIVFNNVQTSLDSIAVLIKHGDDSSQSRLKILQGLVIVHTSLLDFTQSQTHVDDDIKSILTKLTKIYPVFVFSKASTMDE